MRHSHARTMVQLIAAAEKTGYSQTIAKPNVSRSFYFERCGIGVSDYKGNLLFEGDLIKHSNQKEIGVIRYEINACQFRIQYDNKTFIPSCHVGLQMGEKGQAMKIGSIYDNPELLGWSENDG